MKFQKPLSTVLCCLFLIAVQRSYADRVFKYPRMQQEQDQWCWDACSQWIIGFHGTALTQTEICQYGFVDGQVRNEWNYIYTATENGQLTRNNVYGRGINWVIAHWGVTWKVKSGSSANYTLTETEFKNDIENGHPLVVRYNWNDNSGHFVVAMGYQNQMCWLMNPWQNDGIQIYNYQWVKDNASGPLEHHTWDYTLQTTRVDTIPELTTVFPSSLPAVGEKVSLTLTSSLKGRDVTPCTFFRSLTQGVSIDSATRTISWTQTAQGPASVKFAREFGNARDTITKSFANVHENADAIKDGPFTITIRKAGKLHSISVVIPSGGEQTAAVMLYSANGTKVLAQNIAGAGFHPLLFNAKTAAQGVYILKISYGNKFRTEKLIF
jgi:hypothetical protein